MNDYSYTTTVDSSAAAGVSGATLIFALIAAVIAIVAMYKIFTKAGKPGWAAIVPIYNVYILLEIVGRPVWWLVLFLIPFVNLIVSIILAVDLAKSFGKSTVFAIFGLIIFSIVGYLMLAFGSATYQGPSVGGGKPADPQPTAPPAV